MSKYKLIEYLNCLNKCDEQGEIEVKKTPKKRDYLAAAIATNAHQQVHVSVSCQMLVIQIHLHIQSIIRAEEEEGELHRQEKQQKIW